MTSAAISAGRSPGVRRSPGSGDQSFPRRGRRPRRHLTGARLRWVVAGRLLAGGAGRAFLREGDGPFRRGLGSEAVRERAIEALLVITLRRRGGDRQATPSHAATRRPRSTCGFIAHPRLFVCLSLTLTAPQVISTLARSDLQVNARKGEVETESSILWQSFRGDLILLPAQE